MKNYKIIFIISLFTFSSIFAGCSNDDDEIVPEIISPVAGDYVGSETCDQDTYEDIHVDVYNTSFGQNQVWVHNIGDSGIDARGNVSGNTITIAEQEVSLGTSIYKVSGNATVEGKKITLTYKIVSSSGAVVADCIYTGVSD